MPVFPLEPGSQRTMFPFLNYYYYCYCYYYYYSSYYLSLLLLLLLYKYVPAVCSLYGILL